MNNYRNFVRLARPLQLLLATITYSLGAGMARYLGRPVQLASFGLGLFLLIFLQWAAFWLVEYFRLPLTPLAKGEMPKDREHFRAGLFQFATALLTVCGAIIVTMIIGRLLPLPGGILLAVIILLYIGFAVPPMRLAEKGYGELIQAVALGTLFPALAFIVQFGDFHRILTFATFPLTLMALANLLVNDFPEFANDLKFGRHSLLTRLTWQRAIPIHHLLMLFSYLFFAISPLAGFPWGIVWPIFLVLPFASVQVYWLQRIANGGSSNWRFFVPLSATVFGLTAYLLALTFWIR